jgi:hypothetical protein
LSTFERGPLSARLAMSKCEPGAAWKEGTAALGSTVEVSAAATCLSPRAHPAGVVRARRAERGATPA